MANDKHSDSRFGFALICYLQTLSKFHEAGRQWGVEEAVRRREDRANNQQTRLGRKGLPSQSTK